MTLIDKVKIFFFSNFKAITVLTEISISWYKNIVY